jgi:hypothetical protein
VSDEKPTKGPYRSRSALWREHDGRAVLFHEDTGRAFVLNETGTGIWKALDGEHSLEEILGELAAAQRDEALDKAREFCATVEKAGLIEYGAGKRTAGDAKSVPFIPPGMWEDPKAEEIMFGACDCAPGIGNTRNVSCSDLGIPQQSTSTI